MSLVEPVERSYDTLVACPHCAGAVNASLEVERGILDVLTRLALSKAWDDINAPALDRVVTRLVKDYDERVQLRILREPFDESPTIAGPASTRAATAPSRKARTGSLAGTRRKENP